MIFQLCCISAIEGMDQGLLPAVNLALQKDLGLRLVDLSVLTLAQAVAQALAAPIWGVLADRRILRRKALLCTGALFQAWTVGIATLYKSKLANKHSSLRFSVGNTSTNAGLDYQDAILVYL